MEPVVIQRVELLQKLDILRCGLANEGVVDQSNCYVFTGGKVFTYNGETLASARSDLPLEYTGVIGNKLLLEVLKRSADTEITISFDNPSEFRIRLNETEEVCLATESTVLLPINRLPKPGAWATMPDQFLDALLQTSACAGKSTDVERFYISCVHVTPNYLECCDNTQACRYRLKMPVKDEYLVRAEKNMSLLSCDFTTLSDTPDWLFFRNQSGICVGKRKHTGMKYLDLTPSFASGGVRFSLPKILVEAAEKAIAFAIAQNRDDPNIRVTLNTGKVKVSAESTLGWYRKEKKIDYHGPAVSFLINPKFLTRVIERSEECFLKDNCLLVSNDDWKYLTAIEKQGND